MVILCGVWISLCFAVYGLTLWLPNVWPAYIYLHQALTLFIQYYKYGGVSDSVNIYFISFLSALSNLPGNLISIWSVEKIGRARTLVVCMLLSAVSVFFILAIKTTVGTAVSFVSLCSSMV